MKYFIYTSFLFILLNCNDKKKSLTNFYYWKSNVSLGKTEIKYFSELNSNNLYIRVFDVDMNEKPNPDPIAILNKFDSSLLNTKYIPVIFITNRSLQNISNLEIKKLANNIFNLTTKTLTNSNIINYDEIQLDCDWTESTREKYFNLLKELKYISKKKITCTIRLHQIKFKNKTGIPPVDKGYLMCYATSNPNEKTEKNTILNIDLLKDYLENINDYPIDFDIALPLYSWAIITNHLGKIKLINGVLKNELDNVNFTKISENTFKVNNDLFFHGIYINKNFNLKIEEITPELLKETKKYLNNKIHKNYNIVYYHLDEIFLKRFEINDLM